MVRRRTFERMLADRDRDHARGQERLLQVIADLNDRLMHLAGKPWVPAPIDMRPDEPEPLEVLVPDWEQLPDDLGDPY